MKVKFFWIPATDPERAEKALNGFFSTHRILQVDRHFHSEPGGCGWAIAVEYLDSNAGGEGPTGKGRTRIDYKEVLDPETFRIYADLREWRKETAQREGIPPYSVATNEQLATVARERITDTGKLKNVSGFGVSRIEKYGEALPARCRQAIESAPTTSASEPGEPDS